MKGWELSYYATPCSCCEERTLSLEWEKISGSQKCWRCFIEKMD